MNPLQPSPIVYAEHASEIIAQAMTLAAASAPFALVTSLAIEGGAAREVGSLALVDQAGTMTGYLSNGCIDRDIQHHATEALATKRKTLIRYGEGSRYVDLQLPCGGALTVLIDPAPDLDRLAAAHAGFQQRQQTLLTFAPPPDPTQALTERSFLYAPRFRLMLAGRGAVFRAMANASHASGFDLCLLSPDEHDLDALAPLSPSASKHLTAPHLPVAMDDLDEHSAFVTLFHDHDWEPGLLRSALETEARFIGSLGSRRTHKLRLEGLRGMGVAEEALNRLHGPIGLVPSLRDAPFIAVSALSEIIAAFPSQISLLESRREPLAG